MTETAPTGPLAGYRVIEFAANLTGPVAGMWLADQGADVIKVESPAGDLQRYANATRIGVEGMSAVFASSNRNKRSIMLDLKKPSSIDIFHELAKSADVVIQNFRPGVVERMGLGYEDLKKVKPDIIMVSISGFGMEGPYSKQRAYDTVVQAVSGITMAQRDQATGVPNLVKTSIVDKVTAFTVFQATTAALLARANTGKGQHIHINMLNAILAFMWPNNMGNSTWLGENVRLGATPSDIRLVFETKDHFIVVLALANAEWRALCTAVDRTHLIEDPRFKDINIRMTNFEGQYQELKDAFKHKTTEEWLTILRENDTVSAPVNSPENIHLDPHVAAMGIVIENDHPHAGRYRQIAPAVDFSETPASLRRHAPLLGEQTEEILRELGKSAAEIAALKTEGAIRP